MCVVFLFFFLNMASYINLSNGQEDEAKYDSQKTKTHPAHFPLPIYFIQHWQGQTLALFAARHLKSIFKDCTVKHWPGHFKMKRFASLNSRTSACIY